MKKLIYVLPFLFFIGCGNSSKDNEVIGQVKKVTNETPLIFPNFLAADLSLGVMRGGVGSMSAQDIWFYVEDKDVEKVLKTAAESGALVKVKYDVRRITLYVPDHWATAAEIVK